jgi:pimeloyl-ACP methyl ester carboxylesterase
MFGSYQVNTFNGELEVSNIIIPGKSTISGVIYKPKEIIEEAPGVVLAHGISNSKESLTGIGLELAKHGYITLSIDLMGHGRSSGKLDGTDPSLGVVQAAHYLSELPYVSENVGLVGHSLGAGVTLYAATHELLELGVVLIAGGIGPDYNYEGVAISQPNNVLVIIGQYDVLFDMDTLSNDIELTFQNNVPELNKRKGDPEQGTMTMLLMPPTSHLLEPLDPKGVEAAVDWFMLLNSVEADYSQTYLIRETLILLAFIAFVAAILGVLSLNTEIGPQFGFNWRSGAVYGFIGFITFLPAMLMGNYMLFPTQIFGSSIAWWLLIWGITIYLVARYWRKDNPVTRISRWDIQIAIAFFLACYVFCCSLEYFFGYGYRLMVPIMRNLTLRRIQTFMMYLPFMLGHFYSESVWFREEVSNLKGFAVSKLGLFTGIIIIQYVGFFLFEIILLKGFIGFIIEFLVVIVPMLLISLLITHWSQRNNRPGISIILNTLILSWIAAGLFPY